MTENIELAEPGLQFSFQPNFVGSLGQPLCTTKMKTKQNYFFSLKKGWNSPCHITKMKTKWLGRRMWFIQSYHSIWYVTKETDFDDRPNMTDDSLVWLFYSDVGKMGCSHPIKSLCGESFSKWYSFWFCKFGISPYKTEGDVSSAKVSNKTENSVTWV